jgi:glutathione S-transferase
MSGPGPTPSNPSKLSTADLATADEHAKAQEATRPEAGDAARDARVEEEAMSPLFAEDISKTYWQRWDTIQAGFVDEPRRAVEEADSLVAETMKRLAESFAQERNTLEQQWSRGDNVSTEDLRVALRRYRSFFRRLLEV